MLDVALTAAGNVFTFQSLLFLTIGMLIGLIVGVVPGMGGTTALAVFGPMTVGLDPYAALSLAGGLMGAVSFGGSVTSILINLPGGAPNAATCLDGYPLAQQGKAGLALGASASSSSVGGVIGVFTLLLVIPISKKIVLAFGPSEFFLLAMLGLVTIAACAPGKMLRAMIVGGVGLLFAFVGFDNVNGGTRFTFGIEHLWEGVPLAPAMIGLFAFPEMIELSAKGGSIAKDRGKVGLTGTLDGVWASFKYWKTLLRGSLIGTLVGAIPGVGGTVAAFLAYFSTVQASKDPKSFGKGNIEGVIAPEAANNAKDGGNLIPTLAFGIPGTAEMAVLLGVLVLHGMEPGPTMIMHHEAEIYGLILTLTLSSVLASVIGLIMVRPLAMITRLDGHILVPAVIAISFVGAYANDSLAGDIVLAFVFGIIGYLLIRFDYPRLPLVIALVLGELAERSFDQSMMISGGNWSIFVTRPISALLLIMIVAALTFPMLRTLSRRQKPIEDLS